MMRYLTLVRYAQLMCCEVTSGVRTYFSLCLVGGLEGVETLMTTEGDDVD